MLFISLLVTNLFVLPIGYFIYVDSFVSCINFFILFVYLSILFW